MSLKEYDVDDKAIEEWLPWGGITRPSVMRQKDGSYFSVIKYAAYPEKDIKITCNAFKRGWAIWIEHQHTVDGAENFIAILWNPFFVKMKEHAENSITKKDVSRQQAIDYFMDEVKYFLEAVQKVTVAKLLEYQDILNFLEFSLSLGESKVTMPKIPLYIDVLLSQNLDFTFLENDIKINNKLLLVISVLGMPEMDNIFKSLKHINYRHIKRLLLFDKTEAETELDKYTKKWCSHRKIMKKAITDKVVKEINAYYTENLIFLLDEENYKNFKDYMEKLFIKNEMLYIFEEYNLKDVFWGCLPGIYLANITPPLTGVNYLDNLLQHSDSLGGDANV